jgi:hypothetical protein
MNRARPSWARPAAARAKLRCQSRAEVDVVGYCSTLIFNDTGCPCCPRLSQTIMFTR